MVSIQERFLIKSGWVRTVYWYLLMHIMNGPLCRYTSMWLTEVCTLFCDTPWPSFHFGHQRLKHDTKKIHCFNFNTYVFYGKTPIFYTFFSFKKYIILHINVTNMSQTCHEHVTSISRTCHEHVTNMSQTCHEHVTNMSWTCHKKCHEHVMNMSWTSIVLILIFYSKTFFFYFFTIFLI